jgi:hypothetical protein
MLLPSLALFASLIAGQEAMKPGAAGPDLLCGAYCLQVALSAIDLAPGDFKALEKRLGPPGHAGYSLLQLGGLARDLGAQTIAVETTLDNLKSRTEPFACIVLTKEGHFELLFEIGEEKVSIVDPPRAYTLPIQTFSQLWSRKALLIGRQPFASEESLHPRNSGLRLAFGGTVFLLSTTGILCWLAMALVRRHRERKSGATAALLCVVLSLWGFGSGCGPRNEAGARAKGFPSIRINPEIHRLGDVPRRAVDSTIDVETTIRNEGSRDLVLSSIGTSCACTEVILERDRLAPGDATILTAKLKLGDSSEVREAQLTVDSNDPSHPHAMIGFQWKAVNPLRVVPEAPVYYKLGPGQRASFPVDLLAGDLSLCKKCRVLCTPDTPLLSIKSVPTNGRVALAGHQGGNGASETNIGSFQGELTGSLDPEDYRQSVLFRVVCGGEERARLLWPVSWSVRPIIALAPERLWLGLRRGGEPTAARFHVSSADGVPFRIVGLRIGESGSLVKSEYDRTLSPRHLVQVTLRPTGSSGPWRDVLRVDTDCERARTLELPTSAVLLGNRGGGDR